MDFTVRGIGSGTQGPLGFVPEVHSDFIFAIAGEETGFIGSILALTAYLVIVWRLIQTAQQARDRAGTLLVSGYTGLLLCHVFVAWEWSWVTPGDRHSTSTHESRRILDPGNTFALGLCFSVRLRRFVN